ncbi:hypothetical protein BC332_12784 [Capsicum chinense]|nr:hypothetical protein BC332_12784 [Capsicum chinense]
MLSNGETSKKECNELKEKVKAILVKKLTIVELEDQAKILHEDITKHRVTEELKVWQNLIDNANDKGLRYQVFPHLKLEPLSKDENDVNQMHQCLNLWLKMRMNNFLLKVEISVMENLRRKGLKGKYPFLLRFSITEIYIVRRNLLILNSRGSSSTSSRIIPRIFFFAGDKSQMATLIFEDMIGDHHLKSQDLVTPRTKEYARKTHFESSTEHTIHQGRIIARESVTSTSQPMENNATNVILAYLDTMSRDLAMKNERLNCMVGQRVQVGFLYTLQKEGRSSCELRGKNVIPYTPMDLECCVVASRSQVGVVADLPRVEMLESPFCDTLGIVRSYEDQNLVVGTQELFDHLVDEINSPHKNDLGPSSARTYNLTKVPLPSGECIQTLVDPCEKQGESTLVYKLSTSSENIDNDQSGGKDLDVLDCLENPNCDCLGKDGFACDPLATHGSLFLSEDCPFEKESDVCLEISSTSSLSISYVGHIPSKDFETSSKCMHENLLFEVGLWNTSLNPLFVHDISNGDKKGLLNLEDGTQRENESGRDLSPWLRLPFDSGNFLGCEGHIVVGWST